MAAKKKVESDESEVQPSSFQRGRKGVDDNPNVVYPDEYSGLDYDEAGNAVAHQPYNNPEPPAHARPAELNPQTNGPFLDEVEQIRAEQARSGDFVSEATKKRLEEAKAG